MITREANKIVDKALKALETEDVNTVLTEEEISLYGYKNERIWGSSERRKYFDRWDFKNHAMPNIRTDRSRITKTMLKDMKKFIDKALEYHFYGDIEFKTDYNAGMYASTRTGNDKEGAIILYHTFESDSKYWQIRDDRNRVKGTAVTLKELKELVKKFG